MQELLPDFGDLIFSIALFFGLLITIFETLERRREHRNQNRLLDKIAQEYADFSRSGYF